MKKIVSFLLCCVLVFSLSACSDKPEGMSQEVYEYGCASLKLTDDFLNSKMNLNDYNLRFDEKFARINEIMEGREYNNYEYTKEELAVLCSYPTIALKNLTENSTRDEIYFTLESVVAARNHIAEGVNKSKFEKDLEELYLSTKKQIEKNNQ